jgi:hypothetical protein
MPTRIRGIGLSRLKPRSLRRPDQARTKRASDRCPQGSIRNTGPGERVSLREAVVPPVSKREPGSLLSRLLSYPL